MMKKAINTIVRSAQQSKEQYAALWVSVTLLFTFTTLWLLNLTSIHVMQSVCV